MTSDTELAWTPAWRLREMFAGKQLSPLEFADMLLARVERHADLGAFVTVFGDFYREQAKAATEAYTGGGDLPPLTGLPVSLKDSVYTKGQRTTYGSLLFMDDIPEKDAVAAERLRDAGAIFFGKTNLPAGAADHQSCNTLFGLTRNPWDLDRTVGGSSAARLRHSLRD